MRVAANCIPPYQGAEDWQCYEMCTYVHAGYNGVLESRENAMMGIDASEDIVHAAPFDPTIRD